VIARISSLAVEFLLSAVNLVGAFPPPIYFLLIWCLGKYKRCDRDYQRHQCKNLFCH